MLTFSSTTIPVLDRRLAGCLTKKPCLFCKSVVEFHAFLYENYFSEIGSFSKSKTSRIFSIDVSYI